MNSTPVSFRAGTKAHSPIERRHGAGSRRVGWSIPGFLLGVVLASPATARGEPTPRCAPDTIRAESGRPILCLGPEEPLASERLRSSQLEFFPDQAVSILPSREGTLRLLVGTTSTWILEGLGDLGEVRWTSVRAVLGPDGSPDANGYMGAAGAWVDGKGVQWALMHIEDHRDIPNIPGTRIPGFHASIGWARSSDGSHWERGDRVIWSMARKVEHDSSRTDQGAGEPGVVLDPSGRFLQVLWTDHSRFQGRGTAICLARIPLRDGSPVFDSCRKWGGADFDQPCGGGADIPILREESILGCRSCGDLLEAHPTWIPSLQRYAAVFGVWAWKGLADTLRTGTWIAFSDDLLHWESPTRLWNTASVPIPGRALKWEATLLRDRRGDWWLVYGATPKWPDADGTGHGHSMVRRRIDWLVDQVSWPKPRRRESPSR